MSSRKGCLMLLLAFLPAWATPASDDPPRFGRAPTAAEIALWDIDVRPDGTGLPHGRGTVAHGLEVYTTNCVFCHGEGGQGGIKDRLAGGLGTLATAKPIKTVGSYWPYATTLYDYIRRAMPYQAPGSLSDDDYYALSAYLLHINGLLPADGALDQDSLPKVQMPNRNGFVPEPEFRHITNARQKAANKH